MTTVTQTLGLDISDRFTSYCLVDEAGGIVEGGVCALHRLPSVSGSVIWPGGQ